MPIDETFDFKGFLTLIVLAVLYTSTTNYFAVQKIQTDVYFKNNPVVSVQIASSGMYLSDTSVKNQQNDLSDKPINSYKGLNLNAASEKTLLEIPGISKPIAEEIIRERETSFFSNWEDLKERIPDFSNDLVEKLISYGVVITQNKDNDSITEP
ncbi:MAG: helix-hairpin-helix domain-containing protein [Candidatus Riflebacteria bacterium]|nr:helix-hairpin-helix domain-containing protein [Candidatus Riflebacteria bacterium]